MFLLVLGVDRSRQAGRVGRREERELSKSRERERESEVRGRAWWRDQRERRRPQLGGRKQKARQKEADLSNRFSDTPNRRKHLAGWQLAVGNIVRLTSSAVALDSSGMAVKVRQVVNELGKFRL